MESSKRPYKDLADYAQQHGIDAAVLTAAGWAEGVYQGRQCIVMATATGKRYRFLDGDKPSYKSELDYKRCWFGLDRAIGKHPAALVLCNGEVSTLVGQHYDVPAFAMTGGESRLPDNLLDELKRKWKGTLYIALDCDKPGREAAARIHEQLPAAQVLDLNLSTGGDLADFCKLYTTDSFNELQRRAGVPVETAPPPEDTLSESFQTLTVVASTEFEGLQSGKIKHLGLQCRIPDLDRVVGTFMPGRVHIILGATGMGKSTFGVSLALAFMYQAPGLVVSTETPPKQWIAKVAAMQAQVPYDRIVEGTATPPEAEKIREAYKKLSQFPVRVLKAYAPDIAMIEDWVDTWTPRIGARWLLVDSISNVIAQGKNNIFEKTTNASNRLRELTLRANVATLATSQVGRHLRERANKIPTIQDGYGSGALEQDADVVLGLYYHDYYVRQGLVDKDSPLSQLMPEGKAMTFVGKHRHRLTTEERIWLRFRGGIGFYSWEEKAKPLPHPLPIPQDIDMWSVK